jgi:hypothetical protein
MTSFMDFVHRLSVFRFLVTENVVPSSQILFTLMMEALGSSENFSLQELYSVTSQKTALNYYASFRHIFHSRMIVIRLPYACLHFTVTLAAVKQVTADKTTTTCGCLLVMSRVVVPPV